MSDQVLTMDYGGFNPRFLGINLFIETPDDYTFVHDRVLLDGTMKSPKDADLHQISLLSVVDHEARHYQDFLLSPYGMTVYRMRLQALINGMQVISSLRNVKGDILPIPLSRWAVMHEGDRKIQITEWSELFGRTLDPVDLPHWSREAFDTHRDPGIDSVAHLDEMTAVKLQTEATLRAYVRIDQLTRGFEKLHAVPYFQPPYIHEASALTAQLAAIWLTQGAQQYLQFCKFLFDSPTPQAEMWRACYAVAKLLENRQSPSEFEQDFMLPVQRIATITTWALLGNYQLDGEDGCPSLRLVRLFEVLAEEHEDPALSCDITDDESIKRMWDIWDSRTGAVSWRKSFAHHREMTRRGPPLYKRLREEWQGSSTHVLDMVITQLEQIESHQEILANTFKSDLALFLDPFKVIQEEDALPKPDIRIRFRGFGIDSTGKNPRDMHLVKRQRMDGTSYIEGLASASDANDPTSRYILDEKLEIEELMEWCDAIFSELSVENHIHESARIGISELIDKKLLQIV